DGVLPDGPHGPAGQPELRETAHQGARNRALSSCPHTSTEAADSWQLIVPQLLGRSCTDAVPVLTYQGTNGDTVPGGWAPERAGPNERDNDDGRAADGSGTAGNRPARLGHDRMVSGGRNRPRRPACGPDDVEWSPERL